MRRIGALSWASSAHGELPIDSRVTVAALLPADPTVPALIQQRIVAAVKLAQILFTVPPVIVELLAAPTAVRTAAEPVR